MDIKAKCKIKCIIKIKCQFVTAVYLDFTLAAKTVNPKTQWQSTITLRVCHFQILIHETVR